MVLPCMATIREMGITFGTIYQRRNAAGAAAAFAGMVPGLYEKYSDFIRDSGTEGGFDFAGAIPIVGSVLKTRDALQACFDVNC